MSKVIIESEVEQVALDILSELKYKVNQFTIIENNYNRRPDIILFVNGLPLVVIELKNPVDENATAFSAFKQFQTYKLQIPSLFNFSEVLVVSDGFDAKSGTITFDWERFQPWKTIDGKIKAPKAMPQIETLLKGMFNRETYFVRIDIEYRAVGIQDEDEMVWFWIGTHDDYLKLLFRL